jgi:hypothetical protein
VIAGKILANGGPTTSLNFAADEVNHAFAK